MMFPFVDATLVENGVPECDLNHVQQHGAAAMVSRGFTEPELPSGTTRAMNNLANELPAISISGIRFALMGFTLATSRQADANSARTGWFGRAAPQSGFGKTVR
jgi:hypothetical protein